MWKTPRVADFGQSLILVLWKREGSQIWIKLGSHVFTQPRGNHNGPSIIYIPLTFLVAGSNLWLSGCKVCPFSTSYIVEKKNQALDISCFWAFSLFVLFLSISFCTYSFVVWISWITTSLLSFQCDKISPVIKKLIFYFPFLYSYLPIFYFFCIVKVLKYVSTHHLHFLLTCTLPSSFSVPYCICHWCSPSH